jgi:hypothetical protein
VWVSQDTSQPSASFIDKFIAADIPNPEEDPLGYALVAEHMMHGPCGPGHETCPCMKNAKCSKKFPKKYQPLTTIDENGFAVYRRPDNRRYVQKGNTRLDNGWVVPYNMYFLKKFQAHINVEWCNKGVFIKYLFKYVTKGPDCGKVYIKRVRNGEEAPYDEQTGTVNEVKEYLDCRYICEQDACWRVFGFDIHRHYPHVERMPVHLLGENNISFEEDDDMNDVASQEFRRRMMLTEWFVANQEYPDGKDLTYCEFPSRFRWESSARSWVPRRGSKHTGGGKIGRLYYVHPSVGERYFLRMLLLVVKGAMGYEDVRRYNGVLYSTFKDACSARGLLGDDQEWYDAFDEAAAWATSPQLRQLFVTMLLFCEINDEYKFFEKVWRFLADDIQYRFRESIGNNRYHISDVELRNYLLDDLSELFSMKGARIRDHALPHRTGESEVCLGNRLIEEELSCDMNALLCEADALVQKLNAEQLNSFRSITDSFGALLWLGYVPVGKLCLLLRPLALLLCYCQEGEQPTRDSRYRVI